MSYRFPESKAKLEELVKMIKQQPLPQNSNPHLETIALDAGAGLDWQTIIIHDDFIYQHGLPTIDTTATKRLTIWPNQR